MTKIIFLSFITLLSPSLFAGDRYYVEQWALHNDGSEILSAIDDLHWLPIQGKTGVDLDFENYKNKYPHLGENIPIAILDSGIDPDHPDLKNQILYNEAECDKNHKPLDATTDHDGNGYPGDCIGFNFLSKEKTKAGGIGDNKVDDLEGHGTHIAGIIAAEMDNEIGIRGISPHSKIIPVRVTSDLKQSVDVPNLRLTTPPHKLGIPNEDQLGAIRTYADVIARGLLYALKRGAKVINMSHGWPDPVDSITMRDMVKLAHEQGAIVVAAAGNDNNSEPLNPCAYEEVLCVGAMNHAGEVPLFSNYGAKTDLVAPGFHILSTWPRNVRNYLFTDRSGYEFQSGTSMAAPYVAGMIANIWSENRSATREEILARIFLSSQTNDINLNLKRNFKFYFPQMIKALELKPQSAVFPNFKKDLVAKVNPNDLSFSITLPIKNYWLKETSVHLAIKPTSESSTWLQLEPLEEFSLDEKEEKSFTIKGSLLKTDIPLEIPVEIEIKTPKQNNLYKSYLILQKELGSEPSRTQTFKIDEKLMNQDQLRSISDLCHESVPNEFMLLKKMKNGNYTLKLLKPKEDRLATIASSRSIEDLKIVNVVQKWDVNQDGLDDYVVVGSTGGDIPKTIFMFFNEHLEPLSTDYSAWYFQSEGIEFNLNFQWVKIKEGNKSYFTPGFLGIGLIPEKDKKKPSITEKEKDDFNNYHFYVLKKKNADELEISTLDQEKDFFKDLNDLIIRKEKNIHKKREYTITHILPPLNRGRCEPSPQFVISDYYDNSAKYYFADLEEDRLTHITPIENHSIKLEGLKAIRTYPTGFAFTGSYNYNSIFAALYPSYQEGMNSLPLLFKKNIEAPDYFNPFLRIPMIQKVENGGYLFSIMSQYSFYQYQIFPKSSLFSEISLYRFSFMPGMYFDEQFSPIEIKEGDPSIYVYSGAIKANTYYTIESSLNAFRRSFKNSVVIPKTCEELNPLDATSREQARMIFLCKSANSLYYYLLE